MDTSRLVGIVGPCCAGKSTLAAGLRALGCNARPIGQEHSYVPHMWQAVGHPDVLIYLDVSYPMAQRRRWMNWLPADLEEERRRLHHARAHCDLYLHTDALSAEQVRGEVLRFLERLLEP